MHSLHYRFHWQIRMVQIRPGARIGSAVTAYTLKRDGKGCSIIENCLYLIGYLNFDLQLPLRYSATIPSNQPKMVLSTSNFYIPYSNALAAPMSCFRKLLLKIVSQPTLAALMILILAVTGRLLLTCLYLSHFSITSRTPSTVYTLMAFLAIWPKPPFKQRSK